MVTERFRFYFPFTFGSDTVYELPFANTVVKLATRHITDTRSTVYQLQLLFTFYVLRNTKIEKVGNKIN